MAEHKPPPKPTAGEDEYFAKEDTVRMQELRKKLDAERKERQAKMLKEAHWMRCPKCGNQLKEVPFRQVVVDQCENCGYVGFDKGELELIAGSDSAGVIKHILSLFKAK